MSGSKLLPALKKVELDKFASERERLLSEASVEESQKRLSEITFSFKFG